MIEENTNKVRRKPIPKQQKSGPSKKIKHHLYKKKIGKRTLEENEIQFLTKRYEQINPAEINSFTDFPLSKNTQKGLADAGFREPTEIQRESIGLALRGLDILGAAKTGSGKTLAFLIPILENLFCRKWCSYDGCGSLIITPTRELAYQIYEVLKKVGFQHEFSAGLIIGGKDLKFEKSRMDRCNIIICTPGRLLQHMDENPLFSLDHLQVLVLDEADRCLDMGFAEAMNAIIENLPPQRQTLLFSATQTRSVRDLARLSLKDPMFVSVHEHSKFSTPEGLRQSYIVCPLEQKLDMLWSFLKAHKTKKILVFLSTCKQVTFLNTALCRMRPGLTVLALHGRLHQLKRMEVYDKFCRKQSAVLLATDIAARGLDFPAVNWVVQLDCPEDAQTYIHRAGRTARYEKDGETLLVLLPSEEQGMAQQLAKYKIPITGIRVNPKKLMPSQKKIENLVLRDSNLKDMAQRAFLGYIKSVFLMKDKQVFDVTALPTDDFARSLGLTVTPRIRFLQKWEKQKQKNKEKNGVKEEDASDQDSDDSDSKIKPDKTQSSAFRIAVNDDSDDDLIKPKMRESSPSQATIKEEEEEEQDLPQMETKRNKKPVTKVAVAKKALREKGTLNKKIVFDEDGEGEEEGGQKLLSEAGKQYERVGKSGLDLDYALKVMKDEDKYDKKVFQQRLKEMRKKKKLKARGKDLDDDDDVETDGEEGNEAILEGEETFDLDLLPDPDKVYSKRSHESDEKSSSSDESEEQSDTERNKLEDGEDSDDEEASENDEQSEDDDKESDEIEEGSDENEEETEDSSEDEEVEGEKKRNYKRQAEQETFSVSSKKKKKLSLKDEEELALHLLQAGS